MSVLYADASHSPWQSPSSLVAVRMASSATKVLPAMNSVYYFPAENRDHVALDVVAGLS